MVEPRLSWLALTCGALVLGCGSSSGAQGSNDGGTDGSQPQDGTMPTDGSHPKTDGGGPGKDSGPPPDGGHKPDGKAPDGGTDAGIGASVLQHHLNLARDGHYVDSKMTPTHAGSLVLDTTFDGTINGPLWGQPLYVENGVKGKGTYYIADDANDVYALDETTGKPVWFKTPLLGAAAATGACGANDPAPVGITGTPVIDLGGRIMYFSAVKATSDGSVIQTQEIHALSIDDGSEQTGWPVDVGTLKSSGGVTLNPEPQGQRSAATFLNGYVYVAYGGENGDCGTYYGWVVAVPVADPKSATAYTTPAKGCGIWAAGGFASDGVDVFVTTGNGFGTGSSSWANAGSEAVLRFHDGSGFDPSKTTDFFAPSNWQNLDSNDLDLSGTGPLVVDVPGATPDKLIVQLGKSGVLHILDRTNLGGVGTGDGTMGEGVYSDHVSNGQIRTSPVAYASGGSTYVAFNGSGNGSKCPKGTGGDLIAVQITATNPPTFNTVWCASSGGTNGAPIVTTTDATGSNPIVWVVGTEGSNQLTGWDGVLGTKVFDGGGITMDQVQHFSTLIEVNGRIIVGSNDKVYAFTSTTK